MTIIIAILSAAAAAAAAYAAGRLRSHQIIQTHVDHLDEARAAARKWQHRTGRAEASLKERDAKVADLELVIGYLSEARHIAEVELGHVVLPTGAWSLPTAKTAQPATPLLRKGVHVA